MEGLIFRILRYIVNSTVILHLFKIAYKSCIKLSFLGCFFERFGSFRVVLLHFCINCHYNYSL